MEEKFSSGLLQGERRGSSVLPQGKSSGLVQHHRQDLGRAARGGDFTNYVTHPLQGLKKKALGVLSLPS